MWDCMFTTENLSPVFTDTVIPHSSSKFGGEVENKIAGSIYSQDFGEKLSDKKISLWLFAYLKKFQYLSVYSFSTVDNYWKIIIS